MSVRLLSSRSSAVRLVAVVLVVAAVVSGCAGNRSKLPEPSYEQPPLPPWEQSPPEEQGFDPSLLKGEWVSEEPQEVPPDENNHDQGADEVQNSSTQAEDHATVADPKSD